MRRKAEGCFQTSLILDGVELLQSLERVNSFLWARRVCVLVTVWWKLEGSRNSDGAASGPICHHERHVAQPHISRQAKTWPCEASENFALVYSASSWTLTLLTRLAVLSGVRTQGLRVS